jgi:hypothetical protein
MPGGRLGSRAVRGSRRFGLEDSQPSETKVGQINVINFSILLLDCVSTDFTVSVH